MNLIQILSMVISISTFLLMILLLSKVTYLSESLEDMRSFIEDAASKHEASDDIADVNLEKRLENLQKAKFAVNMSLPQKDNLHGRV